MRAGVGSALGVAWYTPEVWEQLEAMGRSALSGKVLKDMGYDQVYNLGAFKDWAESGGAVDKPIEPGRQVSARPGHGQLRQGGDDRLTPRFSGCENGAAAVQGVLICSVWAQG